MEYLKCKTVEELSLGKQSSNWLQTPSGLALEEVRDVRKLRDLVRSESHFFLELTDGPVEFLAGVCIEHGCKIFIAEPPGVLLILSVDKARDLVLHLVIEGDLGNFISTLAVFLVGEAGVVRLLDTVAFR